MRAGRIKRWRSRRRAAGGMEAQRAGHAQVQQQAPGIVRPLARTRAERHPQVLAAPRHRPHRPTGQLPRGAPQRPTQGLAQHHRLHHGPGQWRLDAASRDFDLGQFRHHGLCAAAWLANPRGSVWPLADPAGSLHADRTCRSLSQCPGHPVTPATKSPRRAPLLRALRRASACSRLPGQFHDLAPRQCGGGQPCGSAPGRRTPRAVGGADACNCVNTGPDANTTAHDRSCARKSGVRGSTHALRTRRAAVLPVADR